MASSHALFATLIDRAEEGVPRLILLPLEVGCRLFWNRPGTARVPRAKAA
jgi:hypothetical protein